MTIKRKPGLSHELATKQESGYANHDLATKFRGKRNATVIATTVSVAILLATV